jgi:Tfp pilus assembly protein PilP
MQDPEEVGHVAEIGTYVGRNWGKITMITSGEVVVTEEYQTIDGELVVNNISMRLPGTDDPGGSR